MYLLWLVSSLSNGQFVRFMYDRHGACWDLRQQNVDVSCKDEHCLPGQP